MNLKRISLLAALASLVGMGACVQQEKEVQNDSNTPLHLLQPDYNTPYGPLTTEEIKEDLDRVLHYLEQSTPTRVVSKTTGEEITDYAQITTDAQLERGAYRLASYEWGVTYSAMLTAAEATGDEAYYNYVADRFKFLAAVAPHFRALLDKGEKIDGQMRQILTPHALDDAGAVCAAMIKAQIDEPSLELNALIDNYMDFILNKEYRLADGTFARTRPQHNTLWLDDMFMGIPPVAWYALLNEEKQQACMNEAVRQVLQFAERMWVPEKRLFRHGWVEGMQDHPAFHWGRANGWALLTMSEVLDVLPENYPGRDKILELFREHVRGLAACQSGEGLWHQLLDRNDSYLETSATAIYVYCFAHAINKGWIDPMAYGPVAQLGWHAVTTQINDLGQVENTCVGTGMAFDPAFYYYRPVNVYAAHGYGPVVWAGAEMIKMLKQQHPKMNDSAIQFYRSEQKTTAPIFHVENGGN
ncbi:MAG: glycoside hydrolase family 88 protein [Alistipes sp.]|nr:glycoside hydrolase family 88 protein [Alistipes sp.]